MMNERRDGRYPHEKSLEGARNSASRRAERSKEDVREVYEHADGVTIVYETHAVRLEGVRRTLHTWLLPLGLLLDGLVGSWGALLFASWAFCI